MAQTYVEKRSSTEHVQWSGIARITRITGNFLQYQRTIQLQVTDGTTNSLGGHLLYVSILRILSKLTTTPTSYWFFTGLS